MDGCCRDFASRLFAFMRMTLPSSELRGKLWKALVPAGAPLAADIDYLALGRKFDLFAGDIQSAIAFAAAEVAAREGAKMSKSLPYLSFSAPAYR